MTLLKALPLIALSIWGLAVSGGAPAPAGLPAFGAFEAAALVTLYAFIGFEKQRRFGRRDQHART